MPTLDPYRRIVDATILSPARSIGGVAHSVALVARPVGYERGATVTTATIEGSEVPESGKVDVWFKRGVQWSVKRVVYGEGDAQDVPVAHAMGGNVCASPEPMNLQFHNNDRALIGGDYANRARPGDVLELNYSGGKRRFQIESVAAFGKAPASVNYAPDSAVTKTQDFGPSGLFDLAAHFNVTPTVDEIFYLDADVLTGDAATLYSGIQVLWYSATSGLYTASERVQFTAADAAVVAPYTGAVDQYLPAGADFGGTGSRFWWDEARLAFRFNDLTRSLGATGVTVSGWRRSAERGKTYSYLWPVDEETVIDLAIEGAGDGLASSGGAHKVARAVEAWGSDDFVARVNFRQVIADTGFGKAGLAVSNGIRPGAKQIVVDWYGGTPRVYTIDDDGTVTHEATFAAPADDEHWDVSIARSDATANEWTIVHYPEGGGSTTIATVTFDLGTDSPLVGPYAADGTMLRWLQYDGTIGPSGAYIHTRDSLTDEEPSYFAQRVAGVDLDVDFSRRRELLLLGDTIASVVNVTADVEMTTVFDNQPTSRDEYGVEAGATISDPPILILPLESAGDVFRVTYVPSDPPEAPGDYPPAQGRLNFSTDGGTVNQNRANWFDKVTLLDPLGKWPSGSLADDATATVRRDPVWQSIDSVEIAVYDAAGSPTFSAIDAGDRTDFAVEGIVFLKSSWVAANMSSGVRYVFRITGTEWQRTGGFDAESHRLALASFEALDQAWIVAAVAGGEGGPDYLISTVDYEIGATGYDVLSDIATPTGLAYGTKNELLNNADPEVDDSSLASCGTPSRTLDVRGWTRAKWPASNFLGGDPAPRWIGASAAGTDAGTVTVGTTGGGSPVTVCTHDITRAEELVFEANTAPGELAVSGFGATIGGAGNYPEELSAFVNIAGVMISLSQYLRNLPAGSTCVSAFAEVTVPDDAVVQTQRTIYYGPGRVPDLGLYGWDRYINGGLVSTYRETWNGSAWVVTTPLSTSSTPSAPSEFSLGFVLMGTRKHTRAVLLPEKASASPAYIDLNGDDYVAVGASLPTTVATDGKTHLVSMTEIIQALLDDRGSTNDPSGYFLWPTGGTVPSASTVAEEGFYFGALRAILPDYSVEDFSRDSATGAVAATIDTGVCTFVTMPTNLSIGRILARVRTPSGTISTLSVPSPIPALVVE